MGNPHNPDRYGETWPQHKIDACLHVLQRVKPHVVVSGGYAWHFMAPVGHPEYKHGHDHKDIDIYVPKHQVSTVISLLLGLGLRKVTTKYDRLDNPEEFRRYEKVVEDGEHPPFRITIDFFVEKAPLPTTEINGWSVVEPGTLLGFYTQGHHGSSECFAVQAARKLLDKGIDPVLRPELVEIPERSGP